MTDDQPSSAPQAADWIAATAILVAAVAFAVVRVQPVDVPWHLATARLARALGHWPDRNTFSYTFPDYPLYQQYPAFQAVLYAVYQRGGWEGLSLLACAGWTAVFLLFVRWGGPLRTGAALHLPWALGLYALQRRMVLRPDLITMLALVAMLLALDAYRNGRRWAIATLPIIHLTWVNGHQLFPLSLAVQTMFLAHLGLARAGRFGVDGTDARASLAPPAVALGASIVLCLATPLGWRIVEVTAHTAGSLSWMRAEVDEFARLWDRPVEGALALLTGAPAAWALWRSRRRWSPFDLGVWLLALALALAAVRGLVFLGVISVAVLERTAARLRDAGTPLLANQVRPALLRALRACGVAVTLLLCANAVYYRWARPPLLLGGTQPGLGRCRGGGWGDGALAFLRASPPPGRMLNMSWTSGNALIWGLPEQPVFVDPRFEAYPHPFLFQTVQAFRDDARLAALLARYRPTWIYAEHFRDAVRNRVAALVRRGWAPVYLDSEIVVLVADDAATVPYRAAHTVDLARAQPGDLVTGAAALRAQQRAVFARLMRALGEEGRVAEQRAAALAESGDYGAAAFAGL